MICPSPVEDLAVQPKKLEICLKMDSAFILRNIAFVIRPSEITIALYSIDFAIAI